MVLLGGVAADPFEETLLKKPGSCTDAGSGRDVLSRTKVSEGEVCSRQISIWLPPLLTTRPIPSEPVK
jgi:hypothetical protein